MQFGSLAKLGVALAMQRSEAAGGPLHKRMWMGLGGIREVVVIVEDSKTHSRRRDNSSRNSSRPVNRIVAVVAAAIVAVIGVVVVVVVVVVGVVGAPG